MSRQLTFYKGDKEVRSTYLYTVDNSDKKQKKPYLIPASSVIQVKLPGGVSLSSADAEVTFNAGENKLTFTVSSTKSALLTESDSLADIAYIVFEGGVMTAGVTFVDKQVLLVQKIPNT